MNEPMREEDPLALLMARKRAASAPQDTTDPLARLVALKRVHQPGRSRFTPEQLQGRADRSVAQSEDELEAAGGYNPTTHKIMGTAASLARDVPGAEAAQAFVSSRLNKMPYRETLETIRDVESDAGAAGTIARIGGGALSAAVLPGSPVVQGASYGALAGLGQADPATIGERARGAAVGATVGAIAPKVPGLALKAAKGAVSNVAAGADAALSPFSHGARVRTVGRLVSLAREATQKGAAATDAAAPAARLVEGYRPIGEMIERAPARVLPFRAPSATAAPETPMAQFSALLQKNLDEGMEAAESVKGYPIRNDPASNPELMRRIEEALLSAKGGATRSAARATPRKGITTSPRTVADVLKGGRQ